MQDKYQNLRQEYKTPFIVDADMNDRDLVSEILRASDFTLSELGVDIQRFDNFDYSDIEMELKPHAGTTVRAYKRKSNFPDIPVVVLTDRLYGMSGKELPAYYNSDNRLVMVACNESLRRLASDGSSQLPLALLGAIATVEEMIHFYQHTNLDRDMSGDGTAHWDDFEEHSSNPIEREAAEFFDSIIGKYIKTFYPQSTLTIRKVDAYKE